MAENKNSYTIFRTLVDFLSFVMLAYGAYKHSLESEANFMLVFCLITCGCAFVSLTYDIAKIFKEIFSQNH